MKKKYEDWIGRAVDKSLGRDLLWLSIPILIYAPIYMIWFIFLEKHTFAHYSVIHTAIDDMIPFQEIFVIPYYAWFLYVSVTIAISVPPPRCATWCSSGR